MSKTFRDCYEDNCEKRKNKNIHKKKRKNVKQFLKNIDFEEIDDDEINDELNN